LARWDGDAKGRGATRFGYLVAVFGAVLHRITGQADVAMIVPVALRGNRLLDATVASRLDAVCLRLRKVGRPGTDLLAAGRQVLTDALAAQDVPFNEVVGDLARLRPDIHIFAGLPVFLLQDNDSAPFTIDGCVLEGVAEPVAKEAPNAITVEVFTDPDGAVLRVTVRTDIAPAGLADRITDEFLDLVEQGPAQLGASVAAVPAG
jgi:non-ribosomal peptide synthetase component F